MYLSPNFNQHTNFATVISHLFKEAQHTGYYWNLILSYSSASLPKGSHYTENNMYTSQPHVLIFIAYVYIKWLSCGSTGKESACKAGDLGSIPGLGRCPGEGKGYPLQHSGLENSMDSIIYGVTKSWTGPSDFHFSYIKRNIFVLWFYIYINIRLYFFF